MKQQILKIADAILQLRFQPAEEQASHAATLHNALVRLSRKRK